MNNRGHLNRSVISQDLTKRSYKETDKKGEMWKVWVPAPKDNGCEAREILWLQKPLP